MKIPARFLLTRRVRTPIDFITAQVVKAIVDILFAGFAWDTFALFAGAQPQVHRRVRERTVRAIPLAPAFRQLKSAVTGLVHVGVVQPLFVVVGERASGVGTVGVAAGCAGVVPLPGVVPLQRTPELFSHMRVQT